jgi:hypothetical protein
MSVYVTNELTLQLPDGLKDRTINIFALADDTSSEFSLVLTREQLQEGERLESFVDRQTRLLSERLHEFCLLRRSELLLDQSPAIQTDYRWLSQNGLLHQRQVVLLAKKRAASDRLVLMLTATFPERPLPAWEAEFTALLGSLRLQKV